MRIPAWLRWTLGTAILAAFVAWIDRRFGWETVAVDWARLGPLDLVGPLILVAGGYALRAARIQSGFTPITAGRFGTCLRVMLWHNGLNNLLPMRSGELAFPVLMGRWFDVPVAVAAPRLLWFRALDLWTLVLGAGLALGPACWGWAPVSALAVIWSGLPLLAHRWRKPLVVRLARRSGRGFRVLLRLTEGIPAGRSVLLTTVGWTAANWLVKLTAYAWLLARLGDFSWPLGLLGAVGGEASSVLPVHGVAGAGTYEAGVLAVLAPLGIGLDAALPAAVNLHLFVLAAGTIGLLGALAWGGPRRSTTAGAAVESHGSKRA